MSESLETASLSISVENDGVWLHFEACDGPTHASINIEALADKYKIDKIDGGRTHGVIGKTLLNWCADRRRMHAAMMAEKDTGKCS